MANLPLHVAFNCVVPGTSSPSSAHDTTLLDYLRYAVHYLKNIQNGSNTLEGIRHHLQCTTAALVNVVDIGEGQHWVTKCTVRCTRELTHILFFLQTLRCTIRLRPDRLHCSDRKHLLFPRTCRKRIARAQHPTKNQPRRIHPRRRIHPPRSSSTDKLHHYLVILLNSCAATLSLFSIYLFFLTGLSIELQFIFFISCTCWNIRTSLVLSSVKC